MAGSSYLTPALMLNSSTCWVFLPWAKTVLIAPDGGSLLFGVTQYKWALNTLPTSEIHWGLSTQILPF